MRDVLKNLGLEMRGALLALAFALVLFGLGSFISSVFGVFVMLVGFLVFFLWFTKYGKKASTTSSKPKVPPNAPVS